MPGANSPRWRKVWLGAYSECRSRLALKSVPGAPASVPVLFLRTRATRNQHAGRRYGEAARRSGLLHREHKLAMKQAATEPLALIPELTLAC